jgi:glucosamine--fructose-6-phosphate aminotransferase (isomerizing)
VDLESPESREITTIMLEIQQIMKGNFSSFMHKEIFEQPESVVNTMRGTRAAVVYCGIPDS